MRLSFTQLQIIQKRDYISVCEYSKTNKKKSK
jgi:hypothetical protein